MPGKYTEAAIAFVVGGLVLCAATLLTAGGNTYLSAICALIPLEFYIVYVTASKYVVNEFIVDLAAVAVILILSYLVFYFLSNYTSINRTVAIGIAVGSWAVLNTIVFLLYRRDAPHTRT